VAICLQFGLGASPHAGVEKDLHAAGSIGSMRSWPTRRRA
jgi:hypothetical protein